MEERRIYYGYLKNDHYFVEVKKDLFDEWNVEDIRDITYKDIEEWNAREGEGKGRTLLMALPYLKQGCGDSLKLLKTVKK